MYLHMVYVRECVRALVRVCLYFRMKLKHVIQTDRLNYLKPSCTDAKIYNTWGSSINTVYVRLSNVCLGTIYRIRGNTK